MPRVPGRLSSVRNRLRGVVDPLRTPRRAVFVTGSARSGTTWIAELLRDAQRARLVFEPVHHNSSLPGSPHFREAGTADPELRRLLRRALAGALDDDWVNLVQPDGVFFRRVVKDIRPGVLPLVRDVAPEVPAVYLLRHPIEVAVSRAELDEREGDWWDTGGALAELQVHAAGDGGNLGRLASLALEACSAESSPMAPHVAIWCVENALALGLFPIANGVALRYEDVLVDADSALGSIESLCHVRLARGQSLARPSSTSFRGSGHIGQLGRWRAVVPDDDAERLLAMTSRFGLDHLYGLDPTVALPPLDGPLWR